MFMGRHNLCDEKGELFPIRWTHYFSGAESYQGEVSGKETVQRAFFADIALADGNAAARERFPAH